MKQAIEVLKNKAQEQGYITFEDIISVSEKANLSLRAIDKITGRLMGEGYIILEDKPAHETGEIVDDSEYDRSQIDYDEVFEKVLKIAPQLEEYIESVKNIPAPRPGEEYDLITLAKDRNSYAFTRLTLMFLKVVIRQALFFHFEYGLPLQETIQEGNIGLIKAIDKYRIKPGNRFSTYAPWWIRQNITRCSLGICDKFYVPVYIRDELLRLIKYIGPKKIELAQGNLTKEVNIHDAVQQTGIKRSKIKRYLTYLEEPFSFETQINEDGICVNNNLAPEELVSQIMLEEQLKAVLEYLPEREARILKYRYGFLGEPRTLEEVGNKMGITRERVRQIENQALKRLRKPSIRKQLRDYLD